MRILLISLLISLALPAWAHDRELSNPCEQNLLAHLKTAPFVDALRGVDDIRGQVMRLFAELPSDERERLAERLTHFHASREMSFQVKDEATGRYEKFVAVKATATPAPILLEDYNRLVQSTGPLMRLYRSLLQKIYSIPSFGIRDLGFEGMPAEEAELALEIIRTSIYFEPALVHPNMKDYPFISAGGYDGAIVNPLRPLALFFEPNMGTPSGITNNYQLLNYLLQIFPEFRHLISPYLPKDNTFALLRKAIESNALVWTKRTDGISVVISPGIYNGAHPDVAAIARATGMPLVKSSDLYEDADGWIRLNTGDRLKDPVVTGIYGRMEDSSFIQNDREEIPMISPSLPENAKLEAKLGVKLRPGAIYDFVYDDKGEIVGVHKDDLGRPKLLSVWSTISSDPYRPGARKGTFRNAIVNRKLYYSGLGGRVIDDKRLFRILTQYLLAQDPELAKPIKGLAPKDYDLYFADPTQFVVKDPANSGGLGVRFPVAMRPEEVAALNARVRLNPTAFEIQYISAITTLPTSDFKGQLPIDLRIFVLMFGDGSVDAGPNSILLRTGADGGLLTNTSKGGGYGTGLIVDRKPKWRRSELREELMRPKFLPISRQEEIYQVLQGSRDVMTCLSALSGRGGDWWTCRDRALKLSFQFREILDLLDPWQVSVIAKLRDFAQSLYVDPYQAVALRQSLSRTIIEMGRTPRLSKAVHQYMKVANNGQVFAEVDMLSEHYRLLPTAARLRKLVPPEVAYRYPARAFGEEKKLEFAEYEWVDDPEVQAVIDEVKAFGGEVRWVLRERIESTPVGQQIFFAQEPAYFWINLSPDSPSYLKPVIGIDLSQELALAGLHHELAHFRMLRDRYQELRLKGLNHEEAMRSAYAEVSGDKGTLVGERRAVDAEIAAERAYLGNPYMQYFGPLRRASHYFDRHYVNRFLYPEFEALRMHLYHHVDSGHTLDENFLRETFTTVIRKSLENRERALEYWREREGSEEIIHSLRSATVRSLLTEPFGAERLEVDGTVRLFDSWLARICGELHVPLNQCQ